jgi:hypothetical protein
VKCALLAIALVACGPPSSIAASTKTPLHETARASEDTTPKQDLRLLPPEVYIRSYLQLFGGLAPVDVQAKARGGDGNQLFDAWDDYLAALGLPDYKLDLPRASQTNAIMVAAFERLAIALCDRAVERDLKANPPTASRVVFAFDAPEHLDDAAFGARFDVLHRTFLGYPASLAPGRADDFRKLYTHVEQNHRAAQKSSRFTPTEAAWAAVCYGLARHPELNLY